MHVQCLTNRPGLRTEYIEAPNFSLQVTKRLVFQNSGKMFLFFKLNCIEFNHPTTWRVFSDHINYIIIITSENSG